MVILEQKNDLVILNGTSLFDILDLVARTKSKVKEWLLSIDSNWAAASLSPLTQRSMDEDVFRTLDMLVGNWWCPDEPWSSTGPPGALPTGTTSMVGPCLLPAGGGENGKARHIVRPGGRLPEVLPLSTTSLTCCRRWPYPDLLLPVLATTMFNTKNTILNIVDELVLVFLLIHYD
jgi:hypothetical protein